MRSSYLTCSSDKSSDLSVYQNKRKLMDWEMVTAPSEQNFQYHIDSLNLFKARFANPDLQGKLPCMF